MGKDLAADIGALLTSGATFDGDELQARDIAVIVETHQDARACRPALLDAGIPAVYTGDSDVFNSEAAEDWLCLLEAFDQPHRPGLVRAAAASMFFGETAETLAAGGDALTDRVADTLRYLGRSRPRAWGGGDPRGRAAGRRCCKLRAVLAGRRAVDDRSGPRDPTATATPPTARVRAGRAAGLAAHPAPPEGGGTSERSRRLDSDAAAVQVMTVCVSEGLQFPIVYLPFAFDRYVPEPDLVLFHDEGRALPARSAARIRR